MIPRVAVLAAATSAMLLLAGCSAAQSPPPGLTDAQLNAMTDQQSDAEWNSLGLSSPIPKPDVKRIGYTSGATWSATQADCLRNQGFNAREVSGGLTVDGATDSDPYRIADWTCRTEYPVDVRELGYLTGDQMTYMYDFWAHRLAPCLTLLGFHLAPTPSRAAFIQSLASGRYWTPYYTADDQLLVNNAQKWQQLDFQCEPLPNEYWAYEPRAYRR